MKLRTFILFASFVFFGFIAPLCSALSQGSSTSSPSPAPAGVMAGGFCGILFERNPALSPFSDSELEAVLMLTI